MDITSQVVEAINEWLQSLASQLLPSALDAARQLIFQTPGYDSIPEVQRSWTVVRDVADALFVLAVIVAGIMVMASGSSGPRYTAKDLVQRIVVAAIAANASLAICGGLIKLDNALVLGILGPDPGTATFGQLSGMIQAPHAADQVVGSLVGLAAAVLAVMLVALYIGRDLVLLVATVLSPLALATYAFPQTVDIARIWCRLFAGLLFVQVVQAVLMEVGIELLRHTDWLGGTTSDLTSGLMLIVLLYILFKLPFAAYHWAFGHPLSRSPVVQSATTAAKAVAAAVD